MTTRTIVEYSTPEQMWKEILEQIPKFYHKVSRKSQIKRFTEIMDKHVKEMSKRFDPFRDSCNPVDCSDVKTWIVPPHHVTTPNFSGRIVTIEVQQLDVIVTIHYFGGVSLGNYL